MLSSVLHSEVAVEINISIMRAFVALGHLLPASSDSKIEKLQRGLKELNHRDGYIGLFSPIIAQCTRPCGLLTLFNFFDFSFPFFDFFSLSLSLYNAKCIV